MIGALSEDAIHRALDRPAVGTDPLKGVMDAFQAVAETLDQRYYQAASDPVAKAIKDLGMQDNDPEVDAVSKALARVYGDSDASRFVDAAKAALVSPERREMMSALATMGLRCPEAQHARQMAQDKFILLAVAPILPTGFEKAKWYFEMEDVANAAGLLGITQAKVITNRLVSMLLIVKLWT